MRLSIIAALALGGCFPAAEDDSACDETKEDCSADADTDTDSDSDSDSDSDTDSDTDADTAVVYMRANGNWAVPEGAFESADMGYSFYAPLTDQFVCDVRVDYSAAGPGQEGCPDCDWSFEVTPSVRPTEGTLCSEIFIPGTGQPGYWFWGYYDASYSWIGDGRVNGIATNPSYTYTADDGAEYYLGQTFFIHYTYGRYDGWYFQAWNLPDQGYYQVYGDSEAAYWGRWVTYNGELVYYYYYY